MNSERQLPWECMICIFSYIEPNPAVYTRLAMVSRSFYSHFMADRQWRLINPHGLRVGSGNAIANAYINDSKTCRYIGALWAFVKPEIISQATEPSDIEPTLPYTAPRMLVEFLNRFQVSRCKSPYAEMAYLLIGFFLSVEYDDQGELFDNAFPREPLPIEEDNDSIYLSAHTTFDDGSDIDDSEDPEAYFIASSEELLAFVLRRMPRGFKLPYEVLEKAISSVFERGGADQGVELHVNEIVFLVKTAETFFSLLLALLPRGYQLEMSDKEELAEMVLGDMDIDAPWEDDIDDWVNWLQMSLPPGIQLQVPGEEHLSSDTDLSNTSIGDESSDHSRQSSRQSGTVQNPQTVPQTRRKTVKEVAGKYFMQLVGTCDLWYIDRPMNEFILDGTVQPSLDLHDLRPSRAQMLEFMHYHPCLYSEIPEKFQNDPDVTLKALSSLPKIRSPTIQLFWHSVPRFLRDDREFMLRAASTGPVLPCFPDLRDDLEIVSAAIEYDGAELDYADHELRYDRERCFKALEHSEWSRMPNVFQCSYHDREIMTTLLKINPQRIATMDPMYLRDWEFVNIAADGVARGFGFSIFRTLPRAMRYDRDLVLKVAECPDAEDVLAYTDPKLADDAEIVLKALRGTPLAFQFAGDKTRNNKAVVLEAVTRDGSMLQYASAGLQDDCDVVIKAFRASCSLPEPDPSILQWASERLRSDHDVMMKLASIHAGAYRFASASIKSSLGWRLKAAQNAPCETWHVFLEPRSGGASYATFIAKLASVGRICHETSSDVRADHKKMLNVVKYDPCALFYASTKLKDTRSLVLEAVIKDGGALVHASQRLRDDPELLLEALRTYGGAPTLVSDKFEPSDEFRIKAFKIVASSGR